MPCLRGKLSDFASVFPGLSFRSRIENDPAGKIYIIQPRDISDDGSVSFDSVAKSSQLPGTSELYLEDQDILLQPRGASLSVGVIRNTHTLAVPAAPLITIRCNPSALNPEFLVQYLRTAAAQEFLRGSAAGTYIPQIPRSAVAELPIDLPGLATQRKLAEFAQMERTEADLFARLQQKRAQLFELAIRQLALKDRKRETAAGPNSDPVGAGTPPGS